MSYKRTRKSRQVVDLSRNKSDSNYYVNVDGNPISDTHHHSQDILQLPSDSSSKLETAAMSETKTLRQLGVTVAQSKTMVATPKSGTVDMIGNAGVIDSPDVHEIPNSYEFEIIRLRRRVEELECIVRDRDTRVVSAIAMLEDELVMYRSLLHAHVAETHDGIKRRVLRIESTLETLKEKGSKFYPPLEIPERWRKK